ncbi:hypothetical protein ACOSQ2_014871 [Xanthoceras sorbifolium]
MIVREFKKSPKGKKSDSGFKGANAKKDENNCFVGVTSYQEAERYSSSDESEDKYEDEFKAESVRFDDIKNAFDKLNKTIIKVQKSNSYLLTIVKSFKGERDNAIKISEELKETNLKQEKEIADCMERMKLMKEEIEQK